MRSVSFIVPTHRRPDALLATLAALTSIDRARTRCEVIVVDNSAEPDHEQLVASPDLGGIPVRLLSLQTSGPAAARNAGARVAEGDLLVFCDDDIIVEWDHLTRHLETRARFGDPLVNGVWSFSPSTAAALRSTPFGRYRMDLEDGFRRSDRSNSLGDRCFVVEPTRLSACNLSVRRAVFWDLGGFDESFRYGGPEDQEFGLRARAAGCLLVRNAGIRLLHNDRLISFRQFCARQEVGSHGVVVLARRFPETLGAFAQNDRIRRSDSPVVILKKASKTLLSTGSVLSLLHRIVRLGELGRVPDGWLRPMYRSVIGLHTFRGYRSAEALDSDRSAPVESGGSRSL